MCFCSYFARAWMTNKSHNLTEDPSFSLISSLALLLRLYSEHRASHFISNSLGAFV